MVAKIKFRLDPALGAIGLYRDPDDDNAPLANPLDHLEDVIFHPALRYCGIIDVITGTLNLAASSTGTPETVTLRDHNLGPHGQSGRPMLFGIIKTHPVTGQDVAWLGSVPVQQFDTTPTDPGSNFVRWLTLGADDDDILVFEAVPRTIGGGTLGAIDIDYEIYILDVDLESALPTFPGLIMSNAGGFMRIETPNGLFSMDRRYLKKSTSGLVIPGGKTLSIKRTPSGDSNPGSATWQFKHEGAVDMGAYRTTYTTNTPPPSFTSDVEELEF